MSKRKLTFEELLIKVNKQLSETDLLKSKKLEEYTVLNCTDMNNLMERLEEIGFAFPELTIIHSLVDIKSK